MSEREIWYPYLRLRTSLGLLREIFTSNKRRGGGVDGRDQIPLRDQRVVNDEMND